MRALLHVASVGLLLLGSLGAAAQTIHHFVVTSTTLQTSRNTSDVLSQHTHTNCTSNGATTNCNTRTPLGLAGRMMAVIPSHNYLTALQAEHIIYVVEGKGLAVGQKFDGQVDGGKLVLFAGDGKRMKFRIVDSQMAPN
jgi:hypothetical protein